MLRRSFYLGVGIAALCSSSLALAQDEGAGGEGSGAAEPAEEVPVEPVEEAPAEPLEEAAVDEEQAADQEEAVEDALDTGGAEVPGKQYMFIGARYRNVIIPKFIQGAFADGGETLYSHTPGLEFIIRQDKFEYQLFAMLGLVNFEDVPFKGTTDPETAWELLDADYQILYLGADFMWSTDDFTPGLSLIYGAGAGLGLVFGELTRTQSYPPAAGVTDPYDYVRCQSQGQPNATYCDAENNHYNGFVEETWAEGGSSPLIFPWIAAQIGLRYKLNRQFVARVEVGVMPTGAFFGVGADYGL